MIILQLTYFCCRLVRHSAKLGYFLAFSILFGFGNASGNTNQCRHFYSPKENKSEEIFSPQFHVLNDAFFRLSPRLIARLWNHEDVLRIQEGMELITSGAKNDFYLDGLGYFATRSKISKKQFHFEISLVMKEVETRQLEIGERNSGPDWLSAKTFTAALKFILNQLQNSPQIETVTMIGGNIKNEMLIEMAKNGGYKKVGTNYIKEVPIK